MSLWHKRSVVLLVIWVIVGTGFILSSLSGAGPAELFEDTPQRNLAGGMVAFGVVSNLVVRYFTRRNKESAAIEVDERDEMIEAKSVEFSLGITTVGLYIGALALYETHAKAGTVPVNWLWFLAWLTPVLSHLSQATVATIMYSGVFDRGQS